MNAFFVSCETLMDPSLKGKPVAVSGAQRRSVISTASYEARKYGVHSAMPTSMALQACPQLILIEPHFHLYHRLSESFMNIIRSYTDEIEQASIDECYADVTDVIMKRPRPLDLAVEIQQRIKNEVGLPCSIGVGPNMFLAKMASDMKKPMGITVLRIRDVPQKMWPLPIGDMRGVGKKTEPLMKELNINTIGDLANYKDLEKLRPIFGKNTENIIARANGYDNRTIVKEWNPKSMGISETFQEDVADYDELRGALRALSRKLSTRMRKEKKLGTGVSIRIRQYDFTNFDRSTKCKKPIWSSEDIFNEAIHLFDENWNNMPVRLLGISLSGLKDADSMVEQLDLFNYEKAEKEETRSVIHDLNRMSGRKIFVRASDLLKEKKA
jgi:DNA polymerase-4